MEQLDKVLQLYRDLTDQPTGRDRQLLAVGDQPHLLALPASKS